MVLMSTENNIGGWPYVPFPGYPPISISIMPETVDPSGGLGDISPGQRGVASEWDPVTNKFKTKKPVPAEIGLDMMTSIIRRVNR